MGDFDAKIGEDFELTGCTGPFTLGTTNKIGFKLGKFCSRNNLKIVNTFFSRPREEEWTWRSPDGKTKNEIDHLLANCIPLIKNNKTLDDFLFSSNH